MSETALAGNNGSLAAMLSSMTGATGAAGGSNNDVAEQLLQQFGEGNVGQAVNNIVAQLVGDLVKEVIAGMDMPEFMADSANQSVDSAVSEMSGETPADLDAQAEEVFNGGGEEGAAGAAGSGEDASEGGMDAVGSEINTLMKDLASDEMDGGSGDDDTSGNWIVALAKALGQMSGKHLKSMVELGEKMGATDSEQAPEQYAEDQSKFQASAKMFGMAQEAVTTALKSIGEALTNTARKQ